MPTLETKSGVRFIFQKLPTKEEVSKSPLLQQLLKACGSNLDFLSGAGADPAGEDDQGDRD